MYWPQFSMALVCGLSFAVGGWSATSSAATEPWADKRLTVTDGMLLWLDASTLQAARKAAGLESLEPGDRIEQWPNGADRAAPVEQTNEAARPTYRPTGDFQAVRFESPGRFLRLARPLPPAREVTVFLVAAAYSCPEPFSAFLSTSASGKNDYQTGLNIDQGPVNSARMGVLNVEGTGSEGARNLLQKPLPFGAVVRMCITSKPGKNGVELRVNGVLQSARDRTDDDRLIRLDELVVGCRYYTLGGPPETRNFFDGDLAEAIVFDHVLSDADRAAVEEYLAKKYGAVESLPLPNGAGGGKPLVRVADPPAIQTLVPGFDVRELPVKLTNVNNVLYHRDGSLIALGYDGRIWRLTDKDGDGIEDTAELFWENKRGLRAAVGMDLTPEGYKHGDGALIVGKTECLLVVDTNGDGKADKEIVAADGWKESPHGADGIGAAFNPRDSRIYFGRGTNNFTDPLLHDKEGNVGYSLDKDSGVIFRVSPDLKSREIFATGIRFSVAIRFNRAGDLFCTDQEGATWVPNGNPLDELLHVEQGRHYGFPARHPKYLSNVIDEPSTFDYGPQHQSTCGLNFNEPAPGGGKSFGPAAWQGSAFVSGYSRGKLYRTELFKTPLGYIARNHLFACLNMLTADSCVAPDGSLVVACHSGGPDWGSGPTGEGKLYKIRYADREIAQPTFAWPASPREVRIEFDRPLDPAILRDMVDKIEITAGKFARAGDEFESFWPGYAVVQAQQRAARHDVRVYSVQLTPDRRTLVLAVDPLRGAVYYAVTLRGMGRPTKEQTPKGVLPQYPQIDLDFDLSGVEAIWSADGKTLWTGWLPSLDLAVSREWTKGSAHHDALWELTSGPGELTLKAQLNLADMLRPAVQPGSKIDYELPKEQVLVTYRSSANVTTTAAPAASSSVNVQNGATTGAIDFGLIERTPATVEFHLTKNNNAAELDFSVGYSTNDDPRERPLQLHRMLLPWADMASDTFKIEPIALPKELAGGSWARGRKVFFGEQAGCFKCHATNHQGGTIGPNLSNLIHRDYASVLRDVTKPNFAINPDYVGSTIRTVDGQTLDGVVRVRGNELHVGVKEGKTIVVDRENVDEMRPSSISIMPEGILKNVSPEQTRDLLTFLLSPAPSMPRDYTGGPPPKPRAAAEVHRLLVGAPRPPEKIRPVKIVLAAGAKDHGPGEHDYPAWQTAWKELLSAADQVEIETAWDWPSAEQFQTADAIVFFQHGDWNARRATDVDRFIERGGGLVYIHWAVDGRAAGGEFAKRIGLAGRGAVGYRHGDLTLSFNDEAAHPVLRNFGPLALTDETYWNMSGDLPKNRILASAVEEGKPRPQVWSLEPGKGRVFVSIPGHYSWTFDDPLFRVLLLRGIAWSAHEPVDRFNDLVWPGANVER